MQARVQLCTNALIGNNLSSMLRFDMNGCLTFCDSRTTYPGIQGDNHIITRDRSWRLHSGEARVDACLRDMSLRAGGVMSMPGERCFSLPIYDILLAVISNTTN